MILGLIDETVGAGARQERACEILGLDARTLQRWRGLGIGQDRRAGPNTVPGNKLTAPERGRVVEILNSARFRDLPPKVVVPTLADEGIYLASESTMYRILRAEGQLAQRGRAKPPQHHRPEELVASGPNQVWSWDITYLLSPIRGKYFYLYAVMDIFSRKIVGHAVHDSESDAHAAALISAICAAEGIPPGQLVIHADNGGPMKGAIMLAMLQKLGVAPSFSRPGVSDDNPYIESLFRTLKYRPEYPSRPFVSLEDAAAWVDAFVDWYNLQHFHSAIEFVTPDQRHRGADESILRARRTVYEKARRRHPARWARHTRCWKCVDVVRLNPRQRVEREVAA